MPKSVKPSIAVLNPAEFGSNPMQKFIELLHWEYHTGVLNTKRFLKRNKSAVIKRYRAKAGVNTYITEQIALLPTHIQKVANAVPKPKSIDLMFTTFTDATEYIVQADNVREKVEILSLKQFGSEDIEAALSMENFAEDILIRDIERYKYFYWNIDPPHMKGKDLHLFMRQFDTDVEDIAAGYIMHMEAYYGRSSTELVLLNLGIDIETIMREPAEGIKLNLKIINEKLFLALKSPVFGKEQNDMAQASARMLRALNNIADGNTAGKLRGKLTTKTENEGDIENLKKRSELYDKVMAEQAKIK